MNYRVALWKTRLSPQPTELAIEAENVTAAAIDAMESAGVTAMAAAVVMSKAQHVTYFDIEWNKEDSHLFYFSRREEFSRSTGNPFTWTP
jgi:hypothetical protein